MIARGDGCALDPNLQLRAAGGQFQGNAWDRKADKAHPFRRPMDHGNALGLGRAIHGRQGNPLSRLGNGQGLHPVIDVIGKGRAAIAHIFQVLEERPTQDRIALHRVSQHRKGDGRGAKYRGRDLIEVLDGRFEQARDRLALIQMQGSTGPHRAVKANITRRNMAPRHPLQGLRDFVRILRLAAQSVLTGNESRHH